MKRHLAFCVWGFISFTPPENPATLLMCPVGWNHVHLCITFRLDLNGTLPPLTLGSVPPDKLICGGPSLPLPTAKTPWPCVFSSTALSLDPASPNSEWPPLWKVKSHPPHVLFHLPRTANSGSGGMWSCTQNDLQTTLDGLFQSIQPAGDAYLLYSRKASPLIVWSHILSRRTKRVY